MSCTHCSPNPPLGSPSIGPSNGSASVGAWQPLPGPVKAPLSHELKQCACGCNTYQGTSPIGPTDVDQLDIPVLPVIMDYVDDDEPSDDHEYVSIKATEYADMVSALRSCSCQDH